MSVEQALQIVDQFAALNNNPAWIHADRKIVADQLRERVQNPFLVDQGQSGTCGPASIVFDVLQHHPALYATAVTQLFNLGAAWLNKWFLRPGAYLLQGDLPDDVPQADWIILSSVRDSENWFFDFTKQNKIDGGGTTSSEVVDILEKIGYQQVIDDTIGRKYQIWTSTWNSKAEKLNNSLKRYREDFQVMWSIDADIIDSKINDSPEPDHWVVLAGDFTPPQAKDASVKIPIFTWGNRNTIPRTGGLTYGQFVNGFFGYIAAKF